MRFEQKVVHGWLARPLFVPRKFRRLLADHGSLTVRLKQSCGEFFVRPLRIGLIRPNPDERLALGLRGGELAYVREVVLLCGERPVVFAHSVAALSSLRGAWAAVTSLGTRPLGEALFSNPRVTRGGLRYRRVGARHALARQAARAGVAVPGQGLWARRSLFTLGGHPLMVTEVFLPAIQSVMNHRK